MLKYLLTYMSPEGGGEQPKGSASGGEPQGNPDGKDPKQDKPNETPKGNEGGQTKDGKTPEKKDGILPKDEPKKDDLKPDGIKEDKSKLGQVTSLVEAAGLSMSEVAKIVKENDGKIDLDTMVALKEKHGDAVAGLIAEQLGSIHTEHKSKAEARDKEVYEQVQEAFKDVTEQSGEDTWKELSGWAKDNVSNEHRSEINAMLEQGGLAAKLAVQELVSAFKESQGTQEFQDADLLDGDNHQQQSDGVLISKSDYNRELNALLNKGHVYGESREIAKLDARRAKSIQRGYK